jgi:hypothetical protein
MRLIIAGIIFIIIILFYSYGPEVFRFNQYRVYKEIKCLQERVDRLEDR